MIIIKTTKSITKKFKPNAVTIGNFDGVHIGHKALLLKTVNEAKKIQGSSIAITFNPHPAKIIKQNYPPKLITSYKQKNKLIESLGIDILLCIPFTKEFASMTAINFLENFLLEQIGMKTIIIGKDYSFGKNRSGNAKFLIEYSKKLNFQVIVEEWINTSKINKERISSTLIRNMILEGDINNVNKVLGRKYSMQGKIVHGKKRGSKLLGFPTININPDNDLYPKFGVYAVSLDYKNKTFNGVANIGYNPTFKNKILSLEVHILSFDNKIYGKKIQVNFIKRLRPEIKFPNISELIRQIKKDIYEANKEFKRIKKY